MLDYQGLYNLDKDLLQKLKEHADNISSVTSNSIKELLSGIFENTYNSLIDSVATDPLVEDIVGELDTNVTANYAPSSIDSDVNMQMRNTITELILNKNASAVTPNVVLNALITKDVITIKDLEENQDKFIDYLQMLIPQMIAYCDNTLRKSGLKKIQREDTTQYLLKDDRLLLNKALASELLPIKQIFVSGNNLYCHCSKCNNKIVLSGPALSYIVYATNTARNDIIDSMFETKRGSNSTLLPRVHYCSNCSAGSILSPYDLSVLVEPLRKYMYKGANRFAQNSIKYGRGTSVTRAEVSFSTIQSILDYLYVIEAQSEEELLQVLRNKGSQSEELGTAHIVVDTYEIKLAAEQFYKKLIGKIPIKKLQAITASDADVYTDSEAVPDVVPTKTKDTVTFKELAVHLALNLGRDYNKLKNQALFSLLFMFNETSLIEDVLDMRRIWALEALLKFIDSLPANADSLSESEKFDIAIEYEKRYPDNVNVGIGVKYHTICAMYDSLKEELQMRKANRNAFIKELSENVDMLSYTKIINLNQYKISQIFSIVTDAEMLNLLDEVTDRMIINNLAEDYYEIYTRTNIFNLNKVKTTMESSVAETLTDNLVKMFDKVIDKYLDKTGKHVHVNKFSARSKFSNVSYLSNNSLLCVKELYDAFRDADFYRFIDAIGNIVGIEDSIISANLLAKLKLLIDLAEEDSKSIIGKTYAQFYLQDFTVEELQELDIVNKQRLDRTKFGLLVPKRLSGESIIAYLDRYDTLKQNKTLYTVDCYDYTDEFNKYIGVYADILLCASITGMSYKSYVKAAFIVALCGVAVEDIDRNFGLHLFAVNDRMLAREQNGCENFLELSASALQGEKVYGIAYGYYSSFIADKASDMLKCYEDIVTTSSVSPSKLVNQFSLQQFLQELLLADDDTIIMAESKYRASRNTDVKDIEIADIDVAEFKDTATYELSYYCGSKVEELL